jgi:hypothetical protein
MSAMRCLFGSLLIGLLIAVPSSAEEGSSTSSESVDSAGSGVEGYDVDNQTDYNEYVRATEEWNANVEEHTFQRRMNRFMIAGGVIFAFGALRLLFAFAIC